MKRFIPWMITIAAIGGAVGLMVFLVAKNPAVAPSETGVPPVSTTERIKGPADAKVSLIEYADFQCPACAAYDPMLRKLTEEFGNQIVFAYRNFPLTQIHKNADLAARVAEAAGLQGKFWEMHDMLFDRHDEWAESDKAGELFAQYASSLSLDKDRLQKDADSSSVKAKVENDRKTGWEADIQGTPTFFLQGRQIANPRGYDEFRRIILNAEQAGS